MACERSQGFGGTLTTDATPVEVYNYPLPADVTINFEVNIIARDVNDGTSALWGKRACAKNVGGSVSLVGAPLDVFAARKDLAAATWNVTGAIVDGAISLSAIGAAGRNIQWDVCVEVREFYNG